MQSAYTAGERSAAKLETIARAHLAERGITEVDYVAIADPATLEPVSHANDGTIVALAARVGSHAAHRQRHPRSLVSWSAVVAALEDGVTFRSRVSVYLHPLAGRPILWHVLHSLARVTPPPDDIRILHAASTPGRAYLRTWRFPSTCSRWMPAQSSSRFAPR